MKEEVALAGRLSEDELHPPSHTAAAAVGRLHWSVALGQSQNHLIDGLGAAVAAGLELSVVAPLSLAREYLAAAWRYVNVHVLEYMAVRLEA